MMAMPVILPFLGSHLEDIVAMGTENVVSQAEVFVKHHGSFWYPLLAVLALFFVRTMHIRVFIERDRLA